MGFNPLNPKLNPICHLLALLGAQHILHVGRIRVNSAFEGLNTHNYDFVGLSSLNGNSYIQNIEQFVTKISDKKDPFKYFKKIEVPSHVSSHVRIYKNIIF
jgi:hypothetical protein